MFYDQITTLKGFNMVKTLTFLSITILATLIGMLAFVGDILNPHSFLDSLGAAIRVVIIFMLLGAWLKVCPTKYKKIRRYGYILCVLLIISYILAGINLYFE